MDNKLSSFGNPISHKLSSKIITEHSSNHKDIRSLALMGSKPGECSSVLDLGCGCGFMTEKVAPDLPSGAYVIGIDACAQNRTWFLEQLHRHDVSGEFQQIELHKALNFDDNQFDLILASYSLHYFVELIPEIARVLAPGGEFIAITHSVHSYSGLLETVGADLERNPLTELISPFSLENGNALLKKAFHLVMQRNYSNILTFHAADLDTFVEYVHFKMPRLKPGARISDPLPRDMIDAIFARFESGHPVVINKRDAIFCCQKPLYKHNSTTS